MLGSTVPRLWTPPLRELTEETSYGFDVIWFAEHVLKRPLDEWQQWLAIHVGELLPDGRPRFRQILILVARQNGKTEFLVVLTLYWLFIEGHKLILGTSTNLDYAKESWQKAVDLAEKDEWFVDQIGEVRRANGEVTLATTAGCRYKIAASNSKGGRSLTISKLVMDEVREHKDWTAYNAAVPATNAVPDAQIFMLSNQGDDTAVVLDSFRESAIDFIAHGEGDPRVGLFEWSAKEGSKATDPVALTAANPNLGRRIPWDSIIGDARRAQNAGGKELVGFKTEILCMRVPLLDPAIDQERWSECVLVGDLNRVRRNVAMCLDLSPDGLHATLAAAAVMPDGKVRVEIVKAWNGPTATRDLKRDLPRDVARMKPRRFGYFPDGPAAALAASLSDKGQAKAWPPIGVEVEELKTAATAVCMGFGELVNSRDIVHSDDPLLNSHVSLTEKLVSAKGTWVFTRASGHCDATYAAAGASHIARTMPRPVSSGLIV